MTTQHRLGIGRVSLDAILAMREAYRREMDCQIVHDSWHARGFTDLYLLTIAGEVVGYGAVGGPPGEPRDILKEFYLAPPWRGAALPLFRQLVHESGAQTIEAQTNDRQLTLMLLDFATEVASETLLFADELTTSLPAVDATLRRMTPDDRERAFRHVSEPVGEWGLERGGEILATGGFLTHYNRPYADIYMEVIAVAWRQGLGSYLVQELKRLTRESGHIPAARCRQSNIASRLSLQRAGMFPCARILHGHVSANTR